MLLYLLAVVTLSGTAFVFVGTLNLGRPTARP